MKLYLVRLIPSIVTELEEVIRVDHRCQDVSGMRLRLGEP